MTVAPDTGSEPVPLTPIDVANRTFRLSIRGYAVAEVDAFCDEVASELGRLRREIDELRQQSGAADPGGDVAAAPGLMVSVAGPGSAPVAGAGVVPDGSLAALRTLQLAQRTADEAIAEARAEAGGILAKAQAAASAAEQESASLVAQALGELEWRRDELTDRIEDLRSFEREYRSRLKAYLESQVRALTRGEPDDGDTAPAAVAPAGLHRQLDAGAAADARQAAPVGALDAGPS